MNIYFYFYLSYRLSVTLIVINRQLIYVSLLTYSIAVLYLSNGHQNIRAMNFNYTNNYHSLNFTACPSFEEIRRIAMEFYVVRSASSIGHYSIIPELAGNGRVNDTI